ncbi:MAG: cobalamin biosynthesis protein [Candidatus Bathyarchaeota archaeon]|jgi:adenosylcobinamide-phosphate synthase|nr:cobalamin biosynthesis protein [Candidatus Bathyarchaeota archaeon A05DMB-3]MDH7607014.1 cobalamin biosynthesis protein [Candidatus Bathyarchaeota archaeon]
MELFLTMLIILTMALLLDLTLGEPLWQSPTPLHPTIIISNFVKKILPFFKSKNPKLEKLNGIFLAVITVLITTITAYLILYTARLVFIPAYLIFAAVILKLTICIKLETEMANKAADCVKKKNLEKGREIASLFSRRDVKNLDEKQIASAVIESIAENLADFKLSPMFYYAIFGVPGAVAFKTINILDGTVGFKDKEHVNIGWFSAMADTAANFLLSRLTALLIVLAAFIMRENGKNSWKIMLRDYKKVPSINHGWPMAAMAGALGVQLEKPGYYVIGEMKQELSYEHIKKALKIRNITIALFIIIIELPALFLSTTFIGMLMAISL